MSTKYNTDYLSITVKRAMLLLARIRNAHWWVDVLDCEKSFCRQEIAMPFDEIMEKFDERCYFTVIHRTPPSEPCLEIAFSTSTQPEYFLWMQLPESFLVEFTASLVEIK